MKVNNKLIIFLIIIIGFTLYANSFDNQFFWDNEYEITENVDVKNFNVGRFFTDNVTAGSGRQDSFYRPLILLSYALDYKLWSSNPAGFHLTNLSFHIFSAILIYLIFLSLHFRKSITFLTSILFLIHPLQTEAVTYIAGRTDLQVTFFALLSIYLFIKIFSIPRKKNFYLILSFASFIAALLSKEYAVVIPLLLTLIYFVFIKTNFNRVNIKNIFLKTLPFFITSAIYVALRFSVLKFGEFTNANVQANIVSRFFVFLKALAIYWKLFFIPTDLRFRLDQTFSFVRWDPVLIISALIVILIVWLSILSFKRKRFLFFGFSWFFIGLIPVSGVLIPINYALGERWLRLPSIGIYFLAAVGIVWIFDKLSRLYLKKILVSVLVFYLLSLSLITIKTNRLWKDDITYFSYLLKYYPDNGGIHTNLAIAYDKKEMKEEAFREYQKALEFDPDQAFVHANLGGYYAEKRQFDLAIKEYRSAIKIEKNFTPSYVSLARVYINLGKFNEAISVLEDLRDILPNSWKPYSLLGQVYILKKDYLKAEEHLEKSLSLDPGNLEIENRLKALRGLNF